MVNKFDVSADRVEDQPALKPRGKSGAAMKLDNGVNDAPQQEKLTILLKLISHWRAGDIEAVLRQFHDDIIWHYAAAAAPPLCGKLKARKFLEGFKAQISAIRWRVFDSAESGDRLFVEGVDEYDTLDGVVVIAPYAGVLEFAGPLIIGWRDYVDVGVMEAQRTGAKASAWVTALADRPTLAETKHAD